MTTTHTPDPADDVADETGFDEGGILDLDTYEIPVVEDDSDTRFACFIAGSTLVVRLDDPGELRIPLKLSFNQIKRMRTTVSADAEELEQLIALLDMLGDEGLSATLQDIDMADAVAVSLLFFRAWNQRTKVSLGKLRSSSRK